MSSSETEKDTKSDASDHMSPFTNPESDYDGGSKATRPDVNDPDAADPDATECDDATDPNATESEATELMPLNLMPLDAPEYGGGKRPSTLHCQIYEKSDHEL